jgi:hypothetical protein
MAKAPRVSTITIKIDMNAIRGDIVMPSRMRQRPDPRDVFILTTFAWRFRL